MPVRRSFKKRSFKRKRTYGNKKIARVARAVVRRQVETKERVYPYTSIGTGGVSLSSIGYYVAAVNAPIVTSLCSGIVQGVAGNQRIGRRIFLRGIKLYLAMQPGDNSNYVRMMIVRPKGNSITTATPTQTIVQDVLSGVVASATQWCNAVDKDKYNVYWDTRMYLRFQPLDGSTTTTLPQTRFINKFIKVNKKIEFFTDTDVNAINDLLLIAVSDSAAVTNPGAVAGFIKLWYQDA